MKYIHDVTVWRFIGLNMRGIPQYEAPVVFRGRWLQRDTLYTDSQGRENRSENTVYLPVGDLTTSDYMAFGSYSDLTPVNQASEIKARRFTPNLSGTETEYKYLL